MIALTEQVHSFRYESEARERFSQMLLQIERQLACEFRYLDAEAIQEAVQDGIVNCWIAFGRLVRQGRVDKAFPSVLARFAIRQICEGRTCGAQMNSFDLLSRYAQRKRGIHIERLDRYCQKTSEWIEPLVEDRRASIPDQVAMRVDVPAWLATLSKRAQ